MTAQALNTMTATKAATHGAAFLPDTDEKHAVAWRILSSGCYTGAFSLRDGMIVMHFGNNMKATQRGDADVLWLAENLLHEMLGQKDPA
jgi:hypothetical protein